MSCAPRVFVPADHAAVFALWQATPGVVLDAEADAPEAIGAYLARNPGLSCVVEAEGQVVGAVLCGHDGRRGYLHHLAVAAAWRRRRIASALVARSLGELRRVGIRKCHLFLLADNQLGLAFWEACGWHRRGDICIVSRKLDE